MDKMKCDFKGWVTKTNVLCFDGLTIDRDAFKHNDGKVVPLVWNHCHDDPLNILGNILLEHHDEGIYGYGFFNETDSAKASKMIVKHGDIVSLSICAGQLQKQNDRLMHGDIKEVSLVLAGCNPKARIDSVMLHSDDGEESMIAVVPKDENQILHNDESETVEHSDNPDDQPDDDKTVEDVVNSMTEEQRDVMFGLIGEAVENERKKNKEEPEMKHNCFEGQQQNSEVGIMKNDGTMLTHSEMLTVFSDAKRIGSMKEAALQHGIEEIGTLFPYVEGDGRNVHDAPIFIKRDTGWVSKVMNGVHKTPFSRVKSIFADITAEAARALGYMKGKLKKEEVFTLLKRATAPTTIYKKQKLDRDDVVDITDFNVVAWIKGEMREMLDEEAARAILIGDGRMGDDDDKIKEDCVRPIWKDHELYTIKATVEVASTATATEKAKQFIRTAVKARKNYKGSGNPTLFTTEDVVTDCLLMEDLNGRLIYDSVEKLARVLRVAEIVTVPVMEGQTREGGYELMGIIVNLKDYNVGADKGGAVNLFDDFDIDYNAQKYLIETRFSGALVRPYSAIAIECKVTGAAAA